MSSRNHHEEPGQSGRGSPSAAGSNDDGGQSGDEPVLLGTEFDPEIGSWIYRTLQKRHPGAEITVGSVKVLSTLLNGLVDRVLEEARQGNAGGGAAEQPGGAGAQPCPADAPLTSLDIHKALKRVLPGDPAENRLRPYLPAVTKQAWHLDKQSIKGIKRQKAAPEKPPPEAAAPAQQPESSDPAGAGGKENAAAAVGQD